MKNDREINNIKYNALAVSDPRFKHIMAVETLLYHLYRITQDELFTHNLNQKILDLFKYI